jgi:hypothetical protein
MNTTPQGSDNFRDDVEGADGTYPESWIPDPGDKLIGTLDHYDKATTAYGEADIAVIKDEDTGVLRSFWLLHAVAIREFAKLVPRPGERVAIKRLEDGTTEASPNRRATSYKRYIVRVDGRGRADDVPDFSRHLPPEAQHLPPEQRDAEMANPFVIKDALPFD